MKISLDSPIRKWTAATLMLPALAYLALVTRDALASWLGSRPQLTSLRRATLLDPGNADYQNHLGRFYDLVNRDPVAAIPYYKAAVQLNPHSARYWFDLAGAYQILGDTSNQTAALERAIQADSTTPDVAWEAANLYLVQGQTEKALREFHVVLANDASLANVAVGYCWRISPDVDRLLADIIPPTAEAYIPFLSFLESKQETAGTIKVCNALIQSNKPFEAHYAYEYFQYLIQHGEVDPALLVWQQTVSRFGLASHLASGSNLVVNGDFAYDPIGAGLDWQYKKQSGVRLMLDPTEHHSGRRSLLIDFNGPGIVDAGIFQFVPAQPNTTYEFSAYYKNGDMEGAGGPHFTVQDMYSQAVYYESDELKDAGFWTSVQGEFTTGPQCKLLVLHIRRLPAGSPMRGKLWVDDFRLAKKTVIEQPLTATNFHAFS